MSRPRLILTRYARGDIDRFCPRADFAQEKRAVGWRFHEAGPPPGRTWTLLDGGMRILGVGGLFEAAADHWYAWAVLTELSPREWVEAGKLAAGVLDAVELFNGPRIITATARASRPGARLLLEKLGFEARGEVVDDRIGPETIYQLMVRAA